MTALELQRALASMPSRSAQTLVFRCVDGRSPSECAALYGVGLPQWEVLFLEAARQLVGQPAPLYDGTLEALASQLQRALSGEDPQLADLVNPLRALTAEREEVRRLIAAAEAAAAHSPAQTRELWLRRVAVVLIIVASIYVWLRDRDKPPEPQGTRSRPTGAAR